ncbi:MAG: hypothetical protein ACI4HO_02195 [Ruminococcus sp.]
MLKEYCRAEKCSYRKKVSENKAFCMLPNCPKNRTVIITDRKEETVQSIIARSREKGLIP